MSSAGTTRVDPMAAGLKTLQGDIATTKADIARSSEEEHKTLNDAYQGYQNTSARLADSFERLQKEGESAFQPFKPPTPEDPAKAYGASIAGLMGIASFFTHGSMVASLNSAAAAISAARARNSDEYDRAFGEWKSNQETLSKRLSWENEQLGNIMKLADTDYNAAVAHARELASVTKDKALAVTLDAQGLEGVMKLYDARLQGQEAADKHAEHLLVMGQEQQLAGAMQSLSKPAQAGSYSGLPNAGRNVDLKSVSLPWGELSGAGAAITGLVTGKAYGEGARHVQTKEALEQLRQKTLDAFRASQVGRSLAAQMKAVDDIVPKGGFTTYPTIRESVYQTRQNLDSLLGQLASDAQTAFAMKDKSKLTEDVVAINKIRSLIADYDNILESNPDPNADTSTKSGADRRPSLESILGAP